MQILSKIMLILLAINILTSSVVFANYLKNSERILGDACELKNGQEGICTNIANCVAVKKLFDAGKSSEVENCQFVGKIPSVCCPSEPSQLKTKNPKFEKALCKNVKPKLFISDHIIKGEKADIGEFPYQVALGYRGLGGEIEFKCGGSLIAEDIIISAAHCANKKTETPVMVRLGRTSLDLNDSEDDTPVVDIDIDKIKIHSKYSSRSKQNDIALIKLKKPVEYTKFIDPICLSSKSPTNSKQNFTITGFGTIDTNTRERSDWLQKGIVNEYPFNECKKLLKPLKKEIIDSQFCAHSKDGVDGCQGDSGGPIAYEENDLKYLFGIISYGSGCGSNYPGIYTRIDKYLDWIETEMAALE